MSSRSQRPRVAVVGGSLGGLNAALFLREAGCDVRIYERSSVPLQGQGAGIVLNPATVRYFTEHDILDLEEISVPTHWLRYLDSEAGTLDQQPCEYRFASYTTLHKALLSSFREDHYHLGEEFVGFEQDEQEVTVQFASGRTERCDLLVCADGIYSTARSILLPEVEPSYSGYVAWRGTIRESELPPQAFEVLSEAITYYLMDDGHLLHYPIPGVENELEIGKRLSNWLWYRNISEGSELDETMTDREGYLRKVSVGPGTVREDQLEGLRKAASSKLPAPLAGMVLGTESPFIQAVMDLEVPRMAFGRVCLIGDAAFAARPHAAAGTAKAAEDAWTLGEALQQEGGDVVSALEGWEPGQLKLGADLLARTRRAGRRLQGGLWEIGEPLPFGLHETGDSAMK